MPYTSLPIWAMTVGVPSSNGTTRVLDASTERPRNITASRLPIHTNVVRAFLHCGARKAGTPSEMASTPVTAAPPDANARSTMKNDAP